MFKIVDICAGTGAFTHVFNGSKCVFANDILTSSARIYRANHDNHFHLGDLNSVISKIPKHDVLCAGFPCQPFSIAGAQKGFDDERANVFWSILAILRIHKPNVIILENVRTLRTHDGGNTYDVITKNLETIGYTLFIKILDTRDFGLPQHRKRIFIVGFMQPYLNGEFSLDFPVIPRVSIASLLENNVPAKYYFMPNSIHYNIVSEQVQKHINTNTVYQHRRKNSVRENKSGVCPTLTTGLGTVPIIRDDNGVRKLTPREYFNLQGFPSDYNLAELPDYLLYRLAGNAVSIPVVRAIVQRISELAQPE